MIPSTFRGRYTLSMEDGRRFAFQLDSTGATVTYRASDPPLFVLEYPDGRVEIVGPENPSGVLLVDQNPADGPQDV